MYTKLTFKKRCLSNQPLDTFYGNAFSAEEAQVVVNLNSITGFTPVLWIPFFFDENVTFAVVIHRAWTSHRVPVLHDVRKPSLLDTLIQHSALYYLTYVYSLLIHYPRFY